MNYLMIAATNGENIVRQMLILFVIVVCALILWAAGKWTIKAFEGGPKILKAWDGLFILVGVFVAINFLLSLIGYPIIKF